MKIKFIILIILISFFLNKKTFASEVEFDASKIDVKSNGNLILGYNSNTFIKSKKINIYSDKVEYDKKKNILIFKDNVNFFDNVNELEIQSKELIYYKDRDLINSVGETFIDIKKDYFIQTDNIFFNRELKKIYGKEVTTIKDSESNNYLLKEAYEFDILKETLKAKQSTVIDQNNNKYFFENLMIDLNSKEIAGKEIKVEFVKDYFGNKDNNPILKGKSATSDKSNMKIYKAIFSTCNTENKKCRGWELKSEEFNHDKVKKIFEYKKSWLKIFNQNIFFLPYFNHPDPSVKRKSGFLTPSYSSSDALGISLNTPYYKIISKDRDITFNPRFYADGSFLLQNEYRQAKLKSNIVSDFSFLVGEDGTKSHFFYNQIGEFSENLDYEINLQDVKGDNYLQKHKLLFASPLIKSESLLLSNFDLSWDFKDSFLDTSFKIYEDLSRDYHDRYQYIFPDFNFSKSVNIPENYNGLFDFNSYGYHKNYNTNITEAVIINDFIFKSDDFINSKGLSTNYNLLLKNSNNYSDNSSNFEKNANYDLYGVIKVDTSLPMQKKIDGYSHYLIPRASFRYSPNGNNDISSKDITLNYDNVFNLNRISTNSQVEGDGALSVGLEFQRENLENKKIIQFRAANVIKSKQNKNLPSKSKLNETRSDIFGDLDLKLNNNTKIGYFYSYDKDLKYSNLEGLDLEFSLNQFLTNFYYYVEDNDFGNSENIKNNTTINFDKENKLSFVTSKDLKNDFTQYYDFIYEYKTDCISISLNYNKSFYRDGSLEPSKSISFLIKIIPFTELGVTNLENIIGS